MLVYPVVVSFVPDFAVNSILTLKVEGEVRDGDRTFLQWFEVLCI